MANSSKNLWVSEAMRFVPIRLDERRHRLQSAGCQENPAMPNLLVEILRVSPKQMRLLVSLERGAFIGALIP